jgi:2-polyprenyl-3-methyl-5-hydroxy-6-metoxy-1,4-benzoquinol methylase
MSRKKNYNLADYYKERANEYDKIYLKPERQEDLYRTKLKLHDLFANKNVLEIACGTGYWTDIIAEWAKSVLAFDINEAVIEIAKKRTSGKKNINYQVSDLYNFTTESKFNSLFGGFIWSHIPLQELDNFLIKVKSLIESDGIIVFMDNNFVEGSNTPISYTDEKGNTFQTRELENNSSYQVIKNFPTVDFLRNKVSRYAEDINIMMSEYFWILSYVNSAD